MEEIQVRKPAEGELERMGARSWPIWEKEVSVFDWHYDQPETCYLLEGRVRVEPQDQRAPAEFGAGDLVSFPQGLACTWKIRQPVRKHYRFG